jgi:hypothetical protein
MKSDTETWERLNAYHDGELNRREATAVRAQLRKDPTLRAALGEISELSSALKPLHPATPVISGRNPEVRWFAAGFIPAAAAAVAIIAGAILYNAPDPVKSPLDWHHTFASRSYPAKPSDSPTPVSQWIGNDLDLTSANLTLVDVVTLEGGDSFLHYSGVNGCRLTVGASSSPPVLPAASDRVLVQAWSVGSIYYSMLAEGMDRGKFTAISHLLEEQTEGKPEYGEALLAARDAAESAVPCA